MRKKSTKKRREREKDKETVFVRYPFEESKHLFSSSHKGEEDKKKIRLKLGFHLSLR